MKEAYEIYVSKDDFKFNAAHFMAYRGFRERLHGHNYHVSVRVEGALGADGYVIDFGDIKRTTRAVCAELNEKMIVPVRSDCLTLERDGERVELVCEDGSRFLFPEADCVFLPISHSSAEELAAYLCQRLVDALPNLRVRRIGAVEVAVAETPGQEARWRLEL